MERAYCPVCGRYAVPDYDKYTGEAFCSYCGATLKHCCDCRYWWPDDDHTGYCMVKGERRHTTDLACPRFEEWGEPDG